MKKPLIIIVPLAITVCIAFYIWTAISAKQKYNDLMSKFKEVDSGLTSSSVSVVPNGGTSAVEEVYISSSMKSQLILLIDSLKDIYEISSENSKQVRSTKELRLDTKRLLSYIQNYNQLKKIEVDSQMPDTIIYNSGLAKFNGQKWQSDYFEGVPKEVSITYLNFLRNQLIKNN